MEIRERALYTRDAGVLPCRICASEISPCRRERFYWIDWALEAETGCTLYPAIDKSQNGTLRFTSPLKSRLWEYLNLDGPLGKVSIVSVLSQQLSPAPLQGLILPD